jgi:hypothetical protein
MHDGLMGKQQGPDQLADHDDILSVDMMEVVKFVPPAALAPYVTQIYFFRCDQNHVRDFQPAAPGHLVFI